MALLLHLALMLAQQPPVFQTTSEEVVLDLIVRDKRGRQVRDLRPGDITILENGVPQPLKSFRLLEGAEYLEYSAKAPAQPDRRQLDPLKNIRLITIACDRLDVEGRRLTRQAVTDLTKLPIPPNTFYSVVSLDPRFKVVQPYTSDPILVRWAVERITGGASTKFDPPPAIAAPTAETPASDPIQQRLQEIVGNMEKRMAELERQQQGYLTLDALLTLALSQRQIEGRKTVFLFSEGLQKPPQTLSLYEAVVGQANRSNLTFYTIDARGLLTASPNAPARITPPRAAEGAMDMGDFAMEQSTRNVQRNLEDLAVATGGFLISDTNDLRAPLRRATEDAFTYYMASYSPADRNWDGKFRALEVRLNRPGLTLQSRSGYFALPPGMQTLLFPHEVPLLKALSSTPPPRQIDYRASVFRFHPSSNSRVQCAFHIEIPLKNLTIARDTAAASYKTHVSFLVLIKDPSGTPVRKATRDVPFSGPLDKLDQFLRGNFIYGDRFPLAPGSYTLESAILDRVGEKVSTLRSVFVVPTPVSQEPTLSDIALVRRVDPEPPPDVNYGPEDDRGPDPFRFSGGKVTPLLDSSVPAGPVAFYFSAAAPGPVEAVMEFYREGMLLSRSPIELPAPGPGNRMPYFATAGLSGLKPGDYEMRVVVRQGGKAAESRLGFTISPP